MGIKRLRTVNTQDRVLQQIQDNTKDTTDSIAQQPIMKNQILTNVLVVSAGGTRVAHMLGRELEGWIIIRRRGPAVPYDSQDSEPSPDKFLALQSVNDVSVDLMVF